ncbi:hypothetical protein L4C33_08425 [Vibrio makurazakiensis]|uniref:hypothetical protein n=1 Tax=Vibrio makurazakiensis TaxID=2910250 RepID=UPI003D108D0A
MTATSTVTSATTEQQANTHALLGAALLSSQQVEFGLFGIMTHLSKLQATQGEKQALGLNPDTFLKGNTSDLESDLNLYDAVFGKKLPLTKQEIADFIYHRNLIVRNFWRVTGADIKGGEKLADPALYLDQFLAKCAAMLTKIEVYEK